MHLNYLGPVSRVQNISCFSSFWIPLRAHLWVPLPGLVACWWGMLVVYWNGRQCSFFIGMHTHRNVRTDTAHATQMLSARSSLQRALLLQLQEKLRPERAFLMPLSYLERHWHCFPLPVLGPLQLGISHFVDPLFTAAPPPQVAKPSGNEWNWSSLLPLFSRACPAWGWFCHQQVPFLFPDRC